MSTIYNKVKEIVRHAAIYSIGIFWSIYVVIIPLLRDALIKREDVFTIKDRSEYLAKLNTALSDIGRHETLTLDEERTFHYFSVGDASKPLVLFLHGFPQFWYTWRHQLRTLRNMDYHLVALDMRGSGGSYKPREVHYYNVNLLLADIRGIIQKLSPNGRAACVVGHDWGALMSWQAAAQSWEWDQYQDHSGYIDRLVILNGPHVVVGFQNLHSRLAEGFSNLKSLISDPVTTLAHTWKIIQPCVDQFLKSYYTFILQLPIPIGEIWILSRDLGVLDKAFSKDTEENINIYKAILSADNRAAVTGGINYYRSNALRGFYNEQEKRGIPQPGFIGIPTLVIWGEKDNYINKDMNLPNLDKLVSNLKIVQLPEVGHFVQEESPDKVSDLIRRFITSQKNFHDLDENVEF